MKDKEGRIVSSIIIALAIVFASIKYYEANRYVAKNYYVIDKYEQKLLTLDENK